MQHRSVSEWTIKSIEFKVYVWGARDRPPSLATMEGFAMKEDSVHWDILSYLYHNRAFKGLDSHGSSTVNSKTLPPLETASPVNRPMYIVTVRSNLIQGDLSIWSLWIGGEFEQIHTRSLCPYIYVWARSKFIYEARHWFKPFRRTTLLRFECWVGGLRSMVFHVEIYIPRGKQS